MNNNAELRRACIEAMDGVGEEGIPLRKLQEKIMEECSLGEDWKPAAAITTQLARAGVLFRQRKGRSFWVFKGTKFDDFSEETIPDHSPDSVALRIQAANLIKAEGAVRISHDWPMPKEMWKYFMAQFNSGKVDMVFISNSSRTASRKILGAVEYWNADSVEYDYEEDN